MSTIYLKVNVTGATGAEETALVEAIAAQVAQFQIGDGEDAKKAKAKVEVYHPVMLPKWSELKEALRSKGITDPKVLGTTQECTWTFLRGRGVPYGG